MITKKFTIKYKKLIRIKSEENYIYNEMEFRKERRDRETQELASSHVNALWNRGLETNSI
jgi:hypothetical protein